MPSIYEDYEDLGSDVTPVTPSDIPPGEGWKPPASLPPDFPPRPEPSPDPEVTDPQIFGEDIGFKPRRPLILVPGILATKIETYRETTTASGIRKTSVHTIWPPLNLASGATTRLSQLNDKNTRPVASAEDPFVDGAYTGLVNFLVQELGYTLGSNLFLFGYNWTQSNKDSGRKLAGFIRIVKAISYPMGTPEADRTVDVICHSNGGLVIRSAIKQWGATAARTIYLASPHYGAPKAYSILHPAFRQVPVLVDFLATSKSNLSPDRSLEDQLLIVARQMPSAFELLPDQRLFSLLQNTLCEWDKTYDLSGPTTPFGPQETYVDDEYTRLPDRGRVDRAMEFKKELGVNLPGKLFFVIASSAYATDNYGKITVALVLNSASMVVSGNTANGDGTVPYLSGRGPGPHVTVTAPHTVLPNVRETFWWITRFLVQTS